MAQLASNISDYLLGYSTVLGKSEFWPTVLCSSFCLVTLASNLAARNAAKASRKKEKTEAIPKTLIDEEEVCEGEWTYGVGKGGPNLLGSLVGRSTWFVSKNTAPREAFKFDREENPNSADLPYRAERAAESYTMPKVEGGEAAKAAAAALYGSAFYTQLQTEQGFFPGDYGGPMFLLPGLVIACYVTNVDLGSARKKAMLQYLLNHQQRDGGWGTHIEGQSTMFGTTLNYTAARLVGLAKDSKQAVLARQFLEERRGALAAPQWAKMWLAVLGCYDWRGVNPVPPELWLLPYWFPLHPGRFWCHCRMVYLPMSALYGLRYTYVKAETDPLILTLREELYAEAYSGIRWSRERETIAEIDVYNPQTKLMTFVNWFLYSTLENSFVRTIFAFPLNFLRRRALQFTLDMCDAEDEHTNWIDIGPVNKAFNIITAFARHGASSDEFKRHVARIPDYLWYAEDGLKMQGYNGSQFWDTSFAVHSFAYVMKAAKLAKIDSAKEKDAVISALYKAYDFTEKTQVRENVTMRHKFFRNVSKGGWPFSTRDHGWPITDCTSEGIKATILLHGVIPANKQTLTQERIEEAVEIVIGMQNLPGNGGWASYEANRGYDWYELFNPALVFGDIMIDYSYTECTSACVQALVKFVQTYPDSHLASTAAARARIGSEFIIKDQRPDGSWYGSWAVCFTYAGWFGVEGLCARLELEEALSKDSSSSTGVAEVVATLEKGITYLLEKQDTSGGWGESVKSCELKEWVPSNGPQVVQTAWALISLVRARPYLKTTGAEFQGAIDIAMKNASRFLRGIQLPTGDWPQDGVSGVFNKSCAITYTAYRNVFPIWALAKYAEYSLSQS